MSISNLLAIEGLLITKLEAMGDFDVVGSWGKMFNKGFTQIAPAAYVLYSGYDIVGGPEGRQLKAQLVDQKWTILIVSKNAANVQDEKGVRDIAGPLMYKVFAALNNVKLDVDYGALTFENTQAPKYYSGIGIFPLAFKSRFTIR